MIRWFAAHPTASNLLMLIIIAMGLFSAPLLLRETFPDYSPVEAKIDIVYKGAAAKDVEETICLRLSNALKSVNNLEEFTCSAKENLASAVAKMKPGGDVSRFLDDVSSKVNAIDDFPEKAQEPIITQLHTTDLVLALAVQGDMSFEELENYINLLEQKLYKIDNVANVKIKGLAQRQWQIKISREILQQYGLSISDISNLIRSQNIDAPLGELNGKYYDAQLRFSNQSKSINKLKSLVVLSHKGAGELTLGDIAEIDIGYDPDEEKILFNNERALIVEIYKNKNSDAITLMDKISEFIEEEKKLYDGAINISITQDMTSIVRERLKMLVGNGITGLALVVIFMSIFYRPRLAIWTIIALPVAFAGAFITMAVLNLSLNMITLVGLLVAIGIVVDASIVITDSIAEEAKNSTSALDAVTKGVKRVLPGVISSFLTTIVVFAPLAFLAGELGTVLEVMPIVLLAALTASLIEAFLVLPNHLKNPVAHGIANEKTRLVAMFDSFFDNVKESIGKIADKAIKYRYFVLGLLIITLLGSVGYFAGGNIKMEAMPAMEGDVVEARLLMPQGTTFEQTERIVTKITNALEKLNEELKQPDGQKLIQAVQVRFNENNSAGESGAHLATIGVDLLSAEIRSTRLDQFIPLWREEIGDIYGLTNLSIQEPGFGPAGIPIEIRITGKNLSQMKQASMDLVNYLSGYEGVYNILDNLRASKPQFLLSLSPGASALGFTSQTISSQLRSTLLGDEVDNLQLGQQEIEIIVSQGQSDYQTIDRLADSYLISGNKEIVPLSVLTNLEKIRDWSKITLIDGERAVIIEANVDAGKANAGALVQDIKKNWLPEFRKKYPDLEIEFLGQVAATATTAKSIVRGLAIGMFGVFLILSYQFRSYIEPLIVMIAIPMALIGSIWGHVLMGYDISMPSLIGAASLAGIVVNNSILLLQYINDFRHDNISPLLAAGKASRARARPILITTITTLAGMTPLLLEKSLQAASIVPLVISLVFGLTSSTILVLLVLPALYVILNDIGVTSFKQVQQ